MLIDLIFFLCQKNLNQKGYQQLILCKIYFSDFIFWG